MRLTRTERLAEDPKDRLIRLVGALAFVAIAGAIGAVMMYMVVSDLGAQVSSLSNGTSPAALARRQYQAEERFLLCSRSSTVVAPAKQADVARVCDGYDTLAHAYDAQGVKPPHPH